MVEEERRIKNKNLENYFPRVAVEDTVFWCRSVASDLSCMISPVLKELLRKMLLRVL